MNYSEVTFIVQGAIAFHHGLCVTEKTIQSIRKFYPDSKIILSSWKESELDDLVDQAIVNEDPGAIQTSNDYFRNYNRMVISTSSGIEEAKTKYVAKVRSDFWFDFFYDFLEEYINKEERIIMCMSVQHYRLFPLFISDWFNFGTKCQMKELWSGAQYQGELKSLSEKISFFNKPIVDCDCVSEIDHQFHSEQMLCRNYLFNRKIKYFDNVKTVFDFNYKSLLKSYEILSDEFYVISRSEVGLRSYKHKVVSDSSDKYIWMLFDRARASFFYSCLARGYLFYLYSRRCASYIKRFILSIYQSVFGLKND